MQLSKVLAETISLDGGDLLWIAMAGLFVMVAGAAVLIGGCVAGWKAGRGSERARVVFGVLVAFTVFVTVVTRTPAGLIAPAAFTAFYVAGRSRPRPPGSAEASRRSTHPPSGSAEPDTQGDV